MRADMFKVIVERPRKGKSYRTGGPRRRDDIEGPMQLGMRAGIGHPWLNENLAPLRRFLRAQAGRPWNKVFSEICAGIDRRNTVQQHIHQHLDDFIAVQVEWRDGKLVDLKTFGQRWYRDSLRQELYVDPRTGIIRVNKDHGGRVRRHKERVRADEAEIATRRRRLDANTMLLRLNGLWFRVEVAVLPRPAKVIHDAPNEQRRAPYDERRFDVVMKRTTSRKVTGDDNERERLYGARGLYAVRKRQISRREMEQLGVE